jgi:hypothetical protein
MIKLECKVKGCKDEKTGKPKVVEGYNQQHAETLLAQHMIKHQNEKNRKEAKK